MKRSEARQSAGALVALSILAFYMPVLLLIWLFTVMGFRTRFGLDRSRTGFLWFIGLTVVINALLLGWSSPGTGTVWSLGPLTFGVDGAVRGIMGGLRIAAIVGVNLAWLEETHVAAVLDGLRLPRAATVFLAAIFIAVQDIGRDFARLVDGRRMSGTWPSRRWDRVTATAGLVTPLMVTSLERARIRRDALQVAGIPVSKRFVPIVALTALALAGRLALVAVPNVSLVPVVVFVGGLVFGGWVAMLAAMFAMGISNLLLSGLVPTAFVNVPAMALVGVLGGMLRSLDFSDRLGRILAFGLGIASTFLFSIAADVGEWWLVPEFRGDMAYLQARVAAGLVFNIIPALLHGLLFALVCGPVQTVFKAGQQEPGEYPSSPKAPMDSP